MLVRSSTWKITTMKNDLRVILSGLKLFLSF